MNEVSDLAAQYNILVINFELNNYRLKIEIFGTEDFGASAFLLPVNKKFGYILASLDGRVLSINKRIFDKSFFRLVTEVSWRQLYKINLGLCLPSLLFQLAKNKN